ncbi:PAS domain-containing protein [Anaerobacillus alkaliphilus]|uniref:PAS domain-containing protein n=1 Tax=Anaerobacillus alkaliphilus TaxID=1548597 RepID=A0A4Q0VVB7_9BACI|nr:sigma 54-interacting transcriptional regulator [Anaerobacillus alkaliphilus]RXJ00677.1 PAS domain-containing protein [Anaerobacillus alkaliphilus]
MSTVTDEIIQNYKKILEHVHNGIVIINNQGSIVYCNKSCLTSLNLLEEETIGKHINDIVDEPLEMVFLHGISCPNIIRKVGARTLLVNQAPINHEGRIIGAIHIFQDISELNSTIQGHAEKGSQPIKEVLELLYDGIVIVDKEGIITMMNQPYCSLLGLTMDEVIGKHVTEVLPNTQMHIVVKTGQSHYGEFMTLNGRNIIVMRHPIRKNGEIVGAIGKVMFTNVEDLKTLTERLNIVEKKYNYYKKELKRIRGAKYSFDQIVGNNEKMVEAKRLAKKVANSRSTVLIRGESGTGKELFVHAIHEASNRSEGPLVRINCGAIPANILESELFGYEEGAFTGAKKGGRLGKIEQAQGGTLFLDEIGDMPLHMQVKLLRVLQEKEVERLGGNEISQVDIRVVAATNRPLDEMVKKGEFREDLFYRLNVFHIHIPPLRERGQDIMNTAHFLLGKLCDELGMTVKGFDPQVEDLFTSYQWPGNVREMENVIERAIHLTEAGTYISMQHLAPHLQHLTEELQVSRGFSLEKEIEQAEITAIKRAIKASEGHRVKAAELLGIHRASLYRKLEKYKLMEYE